MELREVEAALEAILFASGEPMSEERLSGALAVERKTVHQLLQKMADDYAYERRGMRLVQMDNSWQLCSAPEYAETVRKALELRRSAKLSQTALEVLAIVAYYQPTTRTYVEQVRGVDSSHTMALLQERHLIEECGRLQVPGRPHLYRTTQEFLRVFHLRDLSELPELTGPDPQEQEGQTDLFES